jgi:hypothetical protein
VICNFNKNKFNGKIGNNSVLVQYAIWVKLSHYGPGHSLMAAGVSGSQNV